MQNWYSRTLEEIAAKIPNAIVDGPFGSNLKVSDYVENGIPVLQGKNITGDRFVWEDIRFISLHKAQQLIRSCVKVGDIVTIKIGSVGYTAIIDDLKNYEYAIIPANLLKITLDPSLVDTEYVYYFLISEKGKKILNDLASNTAQPALSLKNVRAVKVLLPPNKKEQTAIARILHILDKAIEKADRLIGKYQRIKTGLMQELLTKGIDENGNIRSESTHRFKDSTLGRIPEEWEFKSFNELLDEKIVQEIQDGNHGEKHPKSSDFVTEGIPFIMANDILNGEIDIEGCKKITEQKYKSLRVGFAKPGDVLLSHKGSIGFVAIVPDYLDKIMLTPQVTYYRIFNKDKLNNYYLFYFLQSERYQINLKNMAKQSTRDYIGILQQRELYIAYPKTMNEQKLIAKKLEIMTKSINMECNKFVKLIKIKTGLIQDLLSGRVRVPKNFIEKVAEA